jgi:hypothetical protein
MSKPEIPGQPHITREPSQQIKYFADMFRGVINPESLSRDRRAQQLQLQFTVYELIILALDTPSRVQNFLNNQIYYNNDHAFQDKMRPRSHLVAFCRPESRTVLKARCLLTRSISYMVIRP